MAMPDAPCNLVTGLPGASKTCNTLRHVEELRLSSGRQVFYSGIRGLTLDWTEFGAPGPADKPWNTDPSEWFKLPPASIIVIDEAQRLFRPRGNGSAVPEHESAIETVRHLGHTLFLITQDPGLVSVHVRKLCGVHRHYMRKFGSSWVTLHEWAGVRDNVSRTRKDSLETQLTIPKQYFDKYTSAEVHTVKFRLPWKLVVLLLLPVLLIAAFWWIFYGRDKFRDPKPAGPSVMATSSPGGSPGAPGQAKRVVTAQDLAQSLKPRIEGLPYTAPRYDEITAPVRAPVIAGCWLRGETDGFCFTQQGTRITLPRKIMASFIERGSFVDFEPGPAYGAQGDQVASTQKTNRSSDKAE